MRSESRSIEVWAKVRFNRKRLGVGGQRLGSILHFVTNMLHDPDHQFPVLRTLWEEEIHNVLYSSDLCCMGRKTQLKLS